MRTQPNLADYITASYIDLASLSFRPKVEIYVVKCLPDNNDYKYKIILNFVFIKKLLLNT